MQRERCSLGRAGEWVLRTSPRCLFLATSFADPDPASKPAGGGRTPECLVRSRREPTALCLRRDVDAVARIQESQRGQGSSRRRADA